MSPVAEIRLITLRELRRSIRSAKGLAVAVLTLLGAFVASLFCVWIEGGIRTDANPASAEAFVEVKRQIFLRSTGDPSLAAYLAPSPTSLLIFLKVTVWFSPLLVALFGFDAISGELQHREIRFWTARARRSSYFVAKFLGLWCLVGLVTLLLNLVSGSVALSRGYVTLAELVAWGARFWLVSFVIAGAWAAMATLVSSCVRSPILALLSTFAVFFVSWTLGAGGFMARQTRFSDAAAAGIHAQKMAWYEYFYPNAYDSLLLSPEAIRVQTGLAILIAFIGLTLFAGIALFQRRDV